MYEPAINNCEVNNIILINEDSTFRLFAPAHSPLNMWPAFFPDCLSGYILGLLLGTHMMACLSGRSVFIHIYPPRCWCLN